MMKRILGMILLLSLFSAHAKVRGGEVKNGVYFPLDLNDVLKHPTRQNMGEDFAGDFFGKIEGGADYENLPNGPQETTVFLGAFGVRLRGLDCKWVDSESYDAEIQTVLAYTVEGCSKKKPAKVCMGTVKCNLSFLSTPGMNKAIEIFKRKKSLSKKEIKNLEEKYMYTLEGSFTETQCQAKASNKCPSANDCLGDRGKLEGLPIDKTFSKRSDDGKRSQSDSETMMR